MGWGKSVLSIIVVVLIFASGLVCQDCGPGGCTPYEDPSTEQPSAPSPTIGSVMRYCEYGATSSDELAGCLTHVTSAQANSAQSNAGAYARGEQTDCLSDSGPFCTPE